jgi:ABC-type sugar transport system ATPase subunit
MTSLRLADIRKSYGRVEVIHGIDLAIAEGEFVVFVGPSGCGKSTLLRVIAGLEAITSGELLIGGARANEVPAAERGLAMVFQSYALYPHMSVRQNMAFGLENQRLPRAEIDRRVETATRMLRLDGLLERRPGALSGGQRQRVAIGRAVVREPRAFLFDEPLSNLDAELRVQMRGEIAALHDRLGNTMIYVTHDQVEAMTLADRIAVLRAGVCEQFDTPLALYNTPANAFVATFIGSPRMNLVKARVVGAAGAGVTVEIAGGARVDMPHAAAALGSATDALFGLRPEHARLTAAGAGDLDLAVDLTEELGGECLIHGRLASEESFVVRAAGQARARRGERVGLTLGDDRDRHLFAGTGDRAVARA